LTPDEIENDENTPFEGSRDADAQSRVPNAADPARIERARQRAEFRGDQRADFWRKVLDNPLGRQVMWEVLIGMHTFEERFATTPSGFSCPEATWFQAGEKAAGWRLYDALRKACFEQVHLMHTENDPYFADQKKKTRRKPNG
jgi:hypothetical protein